MSARAVVMSGSALRIGSTIGTVTSVVLTASAHIAALRVSGCSLCTCFFILLVLAKVLVQWGHGTLFNPCLNMYSDNQYIAIWRGMLIPAFCRTSRIPTSPSPLELNPPLDGLKASLVVHL